ncbi:MAG: hypothetical protein ACK50L_00075 [Bacteroidota bacterium]
MAHISQFQSTPNSLEYYRNPTKGKIKFGNGALHYRDIPFEKCFDKNGNQLLKVKLSDDCLIYYYIGVDNRKGLKYKLVQID